MNLFGTRYQTVDAKGRMAIPKDFRDALEEEGVTELVITGDKSACLLLMPKPVHEELVRRINAMPSGNLVDALRRRYLAMAETLSFDINGRVLLPVPLREHARIERKAVLMAVGATFQLWSEADVLAQKQRDQDVIDNTSDDEMPNLGF